MISLIIQSCPFSIISFVLYQSPYYQITTKFSMVVVNKIQDTMGMWLKQPQLKPVSVGWRACRTYSFDRKSIKLITWVWRTHSRIHVTLNYKNFTLSIAPFNFQSCRPYKLVKIRSSSYQKRFSFFIFEYFCNLQVMILQWSFHVPIILIYRKQATCKTLMQLCTIIKKILILPTFILPKDVLACKVIKRHW